MAEVTEVTTTNTSLLLTPHSPWKISCFCERLQQSINQLIIFDSLLQLLTDEFNMLAQISIPDEYITYVPPPMRTSNGLVEDVDTWGAWAKEFVCNDY